MGENNLPLAITVCHHLANLVMLNGDPPNRFFYPTLTPVGKFVNYIWLLKGNLMRVIPVLYMKAEKIDQRPLVFHSVLLWCKIVKLGECSAPLWSLSIEIYFM